MNLQGVREFCYKASVMSCFVAITMYAAYSFGSALIDTIVAILSESERVLFNKGAFYLLGAIIGLVDLIWIMIYQGVFKKKLTDKVTRYFTRMAVVSFLVIFIFPIGGHLIVEQIVFNMGYDVCTSETNTWFYLSEIVYSKNEYTCVN